MREERLETAGVPFKLYEPGNPNGLLLLGHRGGSGKDDPRIVEHAHRLADTTGMAVVCIDAPAHGERRPTTSEVTANREVVAATVTGPQDVTVADWNAVVASLRGLGPPVAYVGFSMGAMMGLATIAAFPTVTTAVLWAAGLPPPTPSDDTLPPGAGPFVAALSGLGHADVLMINMSEDSAFPPPLAIRLFSTLEARTKRLMLWPGDHDSEPSEAVEATIGFLNRTHQNS